MMKKTALFLVILFTSFQLFAQVEKAVPNPPNPPRLVVDQAGLLTPQQVQALENKLVQYDDTTSNQIVIYTTHTLDGYTPNEYATALGRKWGVGGKDYNNGVVVLVSDGKAEGENRAIYIATGYGLEGAIPDVIAKQIIDVEMTPNFRAGNFYRGLDEATDALIQAAQGEYKAPEGYGKRGDGKGGAGTALLVIGIVIFWIIISNAGRGGGGGMMSRRGYRGWMGPVIWPGGGSHSGGGGWSGGGGGGGFGGFGGGSFGGGGAGGSW